MKRLSFTPLQVVVHLAVWVRLAILAYNYFTNNLTVNPIQALEIRTGDTAIILLVLSLAITPLNTLLHMPKLLKLNRPLGVYGYMFASIHLLTFAGLDYGFDLGLILQTITEKPFVVVGVISFVILSALALTSFKSWMVRLGKKWKKLHRLVYPVNLLVVLHFAWSVKGDFFRLHGDVLRPLLALVIVLLLLSLRIPAVRRNVAGRLHGLVTLAQRIPGLNHPVQSKNKVRLSE